MKTLKLIQRIVTIAAFITALSLVDGIQVNYKDLWTSFLLFALIMIQLLIRVYRQNSKNPGE